MLVRKVTEIEATSPLGWGEALEEGLRRANKTLSGINEIEIRSKRIKIKNGRIVEYILRLNIIFTIADDYPLHL
jgi:hypothetical protein